MVFIVINYLFLLKLFNRPDFYLLPLLLIRSYIGFFSVTLRVNETTDCVNFPIFSYLQTNIAFFCHCRETERYKRVKWKEVRVGDIVHLSNNETVPADILLLRTSNSHGICYIDTCDLDGETNLKRREVNSD